MVRGGISCVTFGELFNLSEFQFFTYKMGITVVKKKTHRAVRRLMK